MNELVMLRTLNCPVDEHICQTCVKMHDKIRYLSKIEAEYMMFDSTLNAGGGPCGLMDEYGWCSSIPGFEYDANNGIFVKKCPNYKFSKAVYDAYIKSDEWREIAAKRMKKDGYKCVMCGATINLCVHHLTYDNLGTEPLTDLITLCKKCHKNLHGKSEE